MTITPAPHRGGHTAHHRHPIMIAILMAALVVAAIAMALQVRGGGSSSPAVLRSGVSPVQTRAVARFSGLDLAGINNVSVRIGGPQSVVVHADSSVISHVTTRVVAGTLVIGDTGSFTTRAPMSVDVTVPSLEALKLSGDGTISVSGINAPRLTVTVSGSGLLYLTGTVTRLDVTLSGDGKAQLGRLSARDVHAILTGSGVIDVTAIASLDAAVPGAGVVTYSGNPPQVTTSITGTGTVTRGPAVG